MIVRAGGRALQGGRIVPFAPRSRAVAVVFRYFGDRSAAFRHRAGVTIPIVCQFSNLSARNAVVVATGQQGRTCGRTHCGGVKAVVGDALLRDA